MDPDCQQKPDTHWHPFSIDLFGEDGEYTVTLRVRTLGSECPLCGIEVSRRTRRKRPFLTDTWSRSPRQLPLLEEHAREDRTKTLETGLPREPVGRRHCHQLRLRHPRHARLPAPRRGPVRVAHLLRTLRCPRRPRRPPNAPSASRPASPGPKPPTPPSSTWTAASALGCSSASTPPRRRGGPSSGDGL